MLGSLNLGCIRGFLLSFYHGEGAGRKPYPPVSMLKAQLLKHLFRVPSDRARVILISRDKLPLHGFRYELLEELL